MCVCACTAFECESAENCLTAHSNLIASSFFFYFICGGMLVDSSLQIEQHMGSSFWVFWCAFNLLSHFTYIILIICIRRKELDFELQQINGKCCIDCASNCHGNAHLTKLIVNCHLAICVRTEMTRTTNGNCNPLTFYG